MYTIANRGFEASHKQCLVDRDLLSEGCQYVCDICLQHGEYLLHGFVASKQVPPAPAATGAENDTGPIPTTQCDEESELESVIDSLILKLRRKQNHTVVVEQKLNSLLQVIGNKIINPSLKSDTDKFQKLYQTAGTLSDLKSNEFIGNCNNMMVNFLCAVTGRRIDSMDNLLLYTFSVCLESIYHLKNRNLVLPHAFMSNLIQTVTSGSRTVTDINGKILPGASDPTYRTWFYNQGLQE